MKTDQKVKEKEYSVSLKVTDTQKRKRGLKSCHNRQTVRLYNYRKYKVLSIDVKQILKTENYLEKDMYRQNTEENLQ